MFHIGVPEQRFILSPLGRNAQLERFVGRYCIVENILKRHVDGRCGFVILQGIGNAATVQNRHGIRRLGRIGGDRRMNHNRAVGKMRHVIVDL